MCNSGNDPDCPPPNDQCSNAIDISSGGTFQVDIPAVTKQDTDPDPSCPVQGPDVFYAFTLNASENVFFSVLDTKLPSASVQATLELYNGQCPPATGGRALVCDSGGFGRNCGGNIVFPLITSSSTGALGGKPIGPGKFFLTVRATGGAGRWNLTYHHVPTACAVQGEINPPTQLGQVHVGTTCNDTDDVTPSCLAGSVLDDNFIVYKCPSQQMQFTTCDGRTPVSSAGSLSGVLGSVFVSGTKCLPIAGSKQEVACSTTAVNKCASTGATVAEIQIQNIAGGIQAADEPGIFTLSVDIRNTATGLNCSDYGLDAMRK
jgi:hypothetical protein